MWIKCGWGLFRLNKMSCLDLIQKNICATLVKKGQVQNIRIRVAQKSDFNCISFKPHLDVVWIGVAFQTTNNGVEYSKQSDFCSLWFPALACQLSFIHWCIKWILEQSRQVNSQMNVTLTLEQESLFRLFVEWFVVLVPIISSWFHCSSSFSLVLISFIYSISKHLEWPSSSTGHPILNVKPLCTLFPAY